MRKFEVITKDTHAVKLTITKERVTVKLPKTITLVDAERIVKFFKKVADKHPAPQASMRAGLNTPENIFKNGISLGTGSTCDKNSTELNREPSKIFVHHAFEE